VFSGIIEDLGRLVAVAPRGRGHSLRIATALPLGPPPGARPQAPSRAPDWAPDWAPGARVKLGDSIAVMGACLTVEELAPTGAQGGTFTVAAGLETLQRTTLGQLKVGAHLHLERALQLGARLDGHLVSGHVDAVGSIQRLQRQSESVVLWALAPAAVAPFVAEKGSICLDGVSLTVNEIQDQPDGGCAFRVNLIPFTVGHTAAVDYRKGHRVNLEADPIARYLQRLLSRAGGPGADLVATQPTDAAKPSSSGRARLTRQRLVQLGFASRPRGSKG